MSLAPVDFNLDLVIDLPPELRRYGLHRWKTARGRPTKWHLVDTDRKVLEAVRAYEAGAYVPPWPHAPIPMLCGVRTRGVVETLIHDWEALFDEAAHLDVCGACLIQAALAMTNERR